MSEGPKANYIRKIRLAGSKQYFPNRYYTVYDFLEQFSQVAKRTYDITVIEYEIVQIGKSKDAKDIDEHSIVSNITPENNFNNVFSIEDPIMKDLLSGTIHLIPPEDFDPEKFEQETKAVKKHMQEKKNLQIDAALKLLMDLYLASDYKSLKLNLRSLPKFKQQIVPLYKESDVQIFVKAVMNQPIQLRMDSDKNSKKPLVVSTKTKQQIRVYCHPIKGDEQSQQQIAKLFPISDWALTAVNPDSNGTNSNGVTYWSIEDLSFKAQSINQSIKIVSYISIHKNKKGNKDCFQIYSFMFNEIVLKVVINLAQIKHIERYKQKSAKEFQQEQQIQYYFHLAYPPKYFISILKPDTACVNGFIRNWQRAENFIFFKNKKIMDDEFLRLFLFNNTIFRIKLSSKNIDVNTKNTDPFISSLLNEFKGAIKISSALQPYDFGRKLTTLTTAFKYKNFVDKFEYGSNQKDFPADKRWKLKFLILVLVRSNKLLPSQIQKILQKIQKHKQDIDIYIYIFWQNVALLNSVTVQGSNNIDYVNYIQKQYQQVKKLSIADITNKVTSNTDTISFVFRASLTPSGFLYNPPTPQMKGRLMKEYCDRSEHFMRVNITDDNEGTLKNQKYITKIAMKAKMLEVNVLQRKYIPLGWSPSQLRSFSLWYIHQFPSLKRQQVLSFLGDFSQINNPAKKAARIGQSFSSSWTYLCRDKQINEIYIDDDRSMKGYLFTDGIGKISEDLLERLSLKLQIKNLSVIQIRYKGAKGIFVLDSSLPKSTIVMRKSMIKYQCKHDAAAKYLDVLDWNKYKAGFLNRQTIILLKTLGIADKIFEKKHYEHINRISKLSFKDCSIFKHMNQDLNSEITNLEPANVTILHLLRAGFKLQQQPFFRGVLETMKKNGYHQLKVKSNIMIEKSARIIGIIDQWDILEEGQLYCTVYDSISTKAKKEHVEGDVIITRNPCLHPADIRKMVCISNQVAEARFKSKNVDNENLFLNYVNCVIFPKKGDIPVTSQISGSDLDGDNFFICWDPELIPIKDEPIYVIDSPVGENVNEKTSKKEKSQQQPKTILSIYEEMIDFFIEYINYEKLGQIDNSHLVHADMSEFFAKVSECMQLAQIHGKAVDFPKSGFCPEVDPKLLVSKYPDFMEKEQSPEYESRSILGRLYRDIKQRIKNLLSDCEASFKAQKIDDELIRELCQVSNDNKLTFSQLEIRQVLSLLLNYERQLSGLITLVGVDTEYEIYSGNFSIAKDKVKAFGKNRLIATILNMRGRYFDQFFKDARLDDKDKYIDAKQNDLENSELFCQSTRKRALLFYLCSYVTKYSYDENFLSDDYFFDIKRKILDVFEGMSHRQQSKFCGFVWFVIPRMMINMKYRIKNRIAKELRIAQMPAGQQPQEDEQEFI